jgi:hypothetical protein
VKLKFTLVVDVETTLPKEDVEADLVVVFETAAMTGGYDYIVKRVSIPSHPQFDWDDEE